MDDGEGTKTSVSVCLHSTVWPFTLQPSHSKNLLWPPRSWKLHWIPSLSKHVSYALQECSTQRTKGRNETVNWWSCTRWLGDLAKEVEFLVQWKTAENQKRITSHWLSFFQTPFLGKYVIFPLLKLRNVLKLYLRQLAWRTSWCFGSTKADLMKSSWPEEHMQCVWLCSRLWGQLKLCYHLIYLWLVF